MKPAPPLHIIKTHSNLDNKILHTTFLGVNSISTNNIHFTNKTNMTNKIHLNNLLPLSIFPHRNNNHIKLAKSIFPITTSIIPKQIIPSIPSIYNTLISSSQKNCNSTRPK